MNRAEIIQAILNYRVSKILFVAAHYDFFTEISRGRRTLRQLCSRLGTDPRATQILLDALTGVGLLSKAGSQYFNTADSKKFLVRGEPDYIGDNLRYQELVSDAWSALRDVVRTGGTKRPLEYWLLKRKGFSQEYIRGMHNIAQQPAGMIAEKIQVRHPQAMLDVGGGPGTYALAFLDRHPSLTATLLDLPSTLRVSRKIVAEQGRRGRVRFLPGDYHRADFGDSRYDIVLLSHITHNEGPADNQRLVRKAYRALRPGGIAIIHDFMVDSTRTRPRFGALFSVHMLVYTAQGQVYGADEYKRWLLEAGFQRLRRYEIGKGTLNASTVLAAVR